eukprot:2051449-Pyramimonas_sp.AAC.1
MLAVGTEPSACRRCSEAVLNAQNCFILRTHEKLCSMRRASVWCELSDSILLKRFLVLCNVPVERG